MLELFILLEKICQTLYDIEPVIFRKLTKKKFDDDYMNKRFSNTQKGLRTSLQIADVIYIEKNLSTESKLDTLRKIFHYFFLEQKLLLFCSK